MAKTAVSRNFKTSNLGVPRNFEMAKTAVSRKNESVHFHLTVLTTISGSFSGSLKVSTTQSLTDSMSFT